MDVSVRGIDGEYWHWRIYPSGWVRLKYRYSQTDTVDYFGFRFRLDQSKIRRIRWLGLGPHPIWKNRRQGGELGIWSATPPRLPAGILGDLRWLQIASNQLELTIVAETPGIEVGLLAPEFPKDALNAVATIPEAGLSFLQAIPAIGTKFHQSAALGPMSLPTAGLGSYRGSIWFRLSAAQR